MESGFLNMELGPGDNSRKPPETHILASPTRSTAQFFHVGQRVLALWEANQSWYAGTITKAEGKQFVVHFDAGDEGLLEAAHLKDLAFSPGVSVLAPGANSRLGVIATVVRQEGDAVMVQHSDGSTATVSASRLCLPSEELLEQVERSRMPLGPWQAGERLLARWPADGYWYSGTLTAVEANKGMIQFDDGYAAWLEEHELAPLEIVQGTRVEARRPSDQYYYRGVITFRDEDELHIKYDDGRQEVTSLAMLRIDRGGRTNLRIPWWGILIALYVGYRLLRIVFA